MGASPLVLLRPALVCSVIMVNCVASVPDKGASEVDLNQQRGSEAQRTARVFLENDPSRHVSVFDSVVERGKRFAGRI
jgi:hypothetical protein